MTNPTAIHLDHRSHTVAVEGELDIATAPSLSRAISRIASGSTYDVTLDMHRVTFVDASTLGALVAARSALTSRGQRLVVRGVTSRVRRVFEIGNAAHLLLTCCSPPDSAVESVVRINVANISGLGRIREHA